MLEESEIDNIRTHADIVEVISSYLPLTQKGKNYFGVCPFHEDHSPSMSVSKDKQIYKCFSCGAAGNVFTFVKDYENVSFLEAVKIVAEKCGLTFKGSIKAPPKVHQNQREYDIMALTLKYYQNNLNTKEGTEAKAYLKKRMLDEATIKAFDLGLALGDNALNKLLISKKYEINELLDLGLISRNGSFINDLFKDRIIFPIHDLDGNPIGFTGRIYNSSDQAKYINSKESPIFKKGQILFNYHRAKNEIKKLKEVVIVEGNMDAIRMFASGIKNVVALMGTSLTKDQVQIIKNLRAKVILMFDNDEAGEIATIQNGGILEHSGITPLIVRLSGEKDPDEYIIKNGVDALINNLKKPLSFLEFKLSYFKKNKDLTKTDNLVQYIKDIVASLKDIDDDLTKELTIKRLSEEYDVPLELLKKELANISIPKKKTNEVVKILDKKKVSKYDIACQNIIYFMVNEGVYIDKFKDELGYFNIKKYRNLANEIIYYYDTYKQISLASFLTYIENKDYLKEDFQEIMQNVNLEELKPNDYEDFIKAAQKEENQERKRQLKIAIANELDDNKKTKLLQEFMEIKKKDV